MQESFASEQGKVSSGDRQDSRRSRTSEDWIDQVVIEARSRFQFSLRGLLVFTSVCAIFWAILRVIDSPVCSVSVYLSLPGLASFGFCVVSVGSGNVGLQSKISLAVASTFLCLALVVSLVPGS